MNKLNLRLKLIYIEEKWIKTVLFIKKFYIVSYIHIVICNVFKRNVYIYVQHMNIFLFNKM